MIILATVLLGPGSEASVGDAIRSVTGRVHGFVLVESGGGADAMQAARAAALEAAYPARHIHESTFFWTGDYSAARQFALDRAREAGATYALTLDPDERVELPEYVTALLEAHPEIAVWTLVDRDEGYHKERLIRCDSAARWHGRVCENVELPDGQDRGRMRGQFWELEKDEASTLRRYERGVKEIRAMISAGDDRYKWRRHLGSCLLGLGLRAQAVGEFRAARELAESPEDKAWSDYLLCEHEVLDEAFEAAQARAADGLRRHAGFIPEFGWIMAYCQFKAGDLQNASRWAQLVLNTPDDRTRVSFRSKNAKRGAGQILATIHGGPAAADGGTRTLRGVVVPITERFSPRMVAAVESGVYEAAEHALLVEVLTPGDRLLELGGGCGYLAVAASLHIGADRVTTVEADPGMEATIRRTFEANGVTPQLVIGAVGRTTSPRVVETQPDFWSTKTRPGGDTPALAFEALLAEHEPSVLVCDIEGGESELCGVTLPDTLRAVIIEAHGKSRERDVVYWLEQEGYALAARRDSVMSFVRTKPRKAA